MGATNELMHHLSMAACEWFLMFLMFIYAALGFILTRFAQQCKLQTPCLFCFRFDQVFGVEESTFYSSHFCSKHKAAVSCYRHDREMCDACFVSIMKRSGSIKEGKMGINGSCSCCKRHWKQKPRGLGLIKLGVHKVIINRSLLRITGWARPARFRYHYRNNFKKGRDRVVIDQAEHSNSVSDSESSLLNGPHNGPLEENENRLLEVSKDEGNESRGTHSVGESESDIEKLKQQVEYDQEQLRLLHVELEEERNANAIAADEAMAMITRLQDEKASLFMEALQYLRMMDEQAEYDMQDLDKANDLIIEKDKQIQGLETELEFYKSCHDEFKNNLDLEDEKNHILLSLSELELKFHHFSNGNIVENGLTPRNEIDMGATLDLNERLDALESVA